MIGSAVALQTAPLPSLGLGCVALVGQFIVLTILFAFAILMWIVARPLGGAVGAAAFVILLLIILLVILSAIPVAMAIGGLVLRGDRSPCLNLAGAAILSLAILIAGFVPALGGLVFLIVWILGLGAYRNRYLWRAATSPTCRLATGAVAPAPSAPKRSSSDRQRLPGTRRTPHAAGRTSRWWRRHRRPRRSPA